MKKPVFSYPHQPPKWLAEWPSKNEIDQDFSFGIRAYASKVGSREPIHALDWTDTTLELKIGRQKSTWRLQGGQWQISCTCGYRDEFCVHSYLAARLFFAVLKAEEWRTTSLKEEQSASSKVSTGGPHPTDNTASNSGSKKRDKAFLDDFPDSPLAQASVNNGFSTNSPARLEVEVDFHYAPGRVALRFYCFKNDQRNLFRLQSLYNLVTRLQHADRSKEVWSEDDYKFLTWVKKQIYRTPEWRSNLNLLKLSKSRFQNWLKVWQEHPGRFIERSSQKPLQTKPEKCSMRFKLFRDGEMIRVAAITTTESGEEYQFHELYKALLEGRHKAIMDGRILDFKPPVSWQILTDFFSRKNPGIPRDKLLDYLPAIIENRFDLLTGDILHRQNRSDCPICLSANADGGDILLGAIIGEAVIRPDTETPAGGLRMNKEKGLTLTLYQSPNLPAVRQLLQKLPLEPGDNDQYRLQGRVDNVSHFLSLWRGLPNEVEKKYSPILGSLLDTNTSPRPVINLRESSICIKVQLLWNINGAEVSDREMKLAIDHKKTVIRSAAGRWLAINPAAVAPIRQKFNAAGFGAADRLNLFSPDARHLLQELNKQETGYTLAPGAKPVYTKIINQPEPPRLSLPPELKDTFREYQKTGFSFLAERMSYQIGTILADDMGLGKTIQALALLQAMKNKAQNRTDPLPRENAENNQNTKGQLRALVICPASVTGVWLEEAEKFCPGLNCRLYSGEQNTRRYLLSEPTWDLIIINYSLLRNDISYFSKQRFDLTILDEAQRIKNPDTKTSHAVKSINTANRLALTGTPLENRLLDLWSIMDFLNPGFLSSREKFLAAYDNSSQGERLGRNIAPLMIRRTKSMVANELPPRISEVLRVEMGEEQRKLYNELRSQALEKAEQSESTMEILALLTRLRQACCDPRLLPPGIVPGENAETAASAKLETLMEMTEELLAENHSILVFSQFTSMLSLIEEKLCELNWPHYKITGSTPANQRSEIVRQFNQDPEPAIFLLSLKAAGTGLTLTKADYVFIYDPWWNPAVENQAIDRTHRIGQTKSVVAYRLVVANSIEENVVRQQQGKAELFEAVVSESTGEEAQVAKFTDADLRRLLS